MYDRDLNAFLEPLLDELARRTDFESLRPFLLDQWDLNSGPLSSQEKTDRLIGRLCQPREQPLGLLAELNEEEYEAIDCARSLLVKEIHRYIAAEGVMERGKDAAFAFVLLLRVALHLRDQCVVFGGLGNVKFLSALTIVLSWQGFAVLGMWTTVLCGLRDRNLREGVADFSLLAIDGNLVAACAMLQRTVAHSGSGIEPLDLALAARLDSPDADPIGAALFGAALDPVDDFLASRYVRRPRA